MFEMRNERIKLQEVKPQRESKVVDMRTWLEQKRDATKNVLMFTRRLATPTNDHPPSVA